MFTPSKVGGIFRNFLHPQALAIQVILKTMVDHGLHHNPT